jgi:hypothetical protein
MLQKACMFTWGCENFQSYTTHSWVYINLQKKSSVMLRTGLDRNLLWKQRSCIQNTNMKIFWTLRALVRHVLSFKLQQCRVIGSCNWIRNRLTSVVIPVLYLFMATTVFNLILSEQVQATQWHWPWSVCNLLHTAYGHAIDGCFVSFLL